MIIFDEIEWDKKIRNPLWYLEYVVVAKDLLNLQKSNKAEYQILKEKVYSFFEKNLREGKISLGDSGKNFDLERKPIDTAIIHHTGGASGLTSDRLSAVHLLRLYAPNYAKPKYKEDEQIAFTPIYSGHFNEAGKQVFYAYTWIIRNDGTYERLLKDSEVGWQAGNWEVNCRSIGIVFDNAFDDSRPTDIMLKSCAEIIRKYYPQIKPERVFGHSEINKNTFCPSRNFILENGEGWKDDLINLIKSI